MFRLALALGCTVQELGGRVAYAELVEWMAYYMVEPWGCEPDDIRHAILAAASVAPFSKRRVKPRDFKVRWFKPRPSEDEVAAMIWQWAAIASKQNRSAENG